MESRLVVAAIGGPDTIRRKLARFLDQTGVDELIFTSDLYEHRLRLRSFEIAAEVMKSFASASSIADSPVGASVS